jgi:hypothetical protein
MDASDPSNLKISAASWTMWKSAEPGGHTCLNDGLGNWGEIISQCSSRYSSYTLNTVRFSFLLPRMTLNHSLNGNEGVSTTSSMDNCPPIAVIGMSGRFPGDAVDVDNLWKLCYEKRDAWSEIPETKFNKSAFYHPDATRNGAVGIGAFFEMIR